MRDICISQSVQIAPRPSFPPGPRFVLGCIVRRNAPLLDTRAWLAGRISVELTEGPSPLPHTLAIAGEGQSGIEFPRKESIYPGRLFTYLRF